jgi:hypothetical protein
MLRGCLPLLVLICVSTLNAQQLPGTEIYLFDLKNGKKELVLSGAKNITQHPGYDNQPFFHPDKPLLYYASGNDEGRTDILEYNIETGARRHITTTHEREYSPTLTPDKKFISCIIQRDSGAQDLGKYPTDGGESQIIINSLVVGYHAWADDSHVFVFALGTPNTLRCFFVNEKKDLLIAENIGRSIHRIPGSTDISFVDKTTDKWLIKKVNSKGETIETIHETLPNREDLSWTPDGKLVTSDGQKFFFLQPRKKGGWEEIKLESALSLKGITRLAINNDGTKLAVVVSE